MRVMIWIEEKHENVNGDEKREDVRGYGDYEAVRKREWRKNYKVWREEDSESEDGKEYE